MTQEAKTEAQRVIDAYEGMRTGEGNFGDVWLIMVDMARRVKELEDMVDTLRANAKK